MSSDSGPRGPRTESARRGGRGRLALIVAVVLLVALPIAEIAALVFAGRRIGVLPTVLAVVAVSMLGLWLMKREGLSTWRSLTAATEAGRMPTTEVTEAAVVLFAGALFLLPGFLSDVAAIVLLLPFVRRAAARLLRRSVERRVTARVGVVRSVRVDAPTVDTSTTGPTHPTGPRELPHLDLRPPNERR